MDALTPHAGVAHVLALNSGSSSLKFGLYRIGDGILETLLSGEAEIGGKDGKFRAADADGKTIADETVPMTGQADAVARIGRLLQDSQAPAPDAIGHRIVHGGPKLRHHCLIDDDVLRQLETATCFAPLHTPPAMEVARFAREHFAGAAQVACLDTAFHADMPDFAHTLPIPRNLRDAGLQRYGFHGLSCESIVHRLATRVPERLIIAHLGNGASVTAVRDGRSIDTSMGLTPTGGVIMGTRTGDLDPGLLAYLVREKHFDAAMIEDLIDHRSGLKGISGIASDMRRLQEAAPSNLDAKLAIMMFCYSVRKQIAAMIAALDGLDMLVFTGGIGEHDAAVRAEICGGLSWIGIDMHGARNKAATNPLDASGSRCAIRVLPSDEDGMIARHAWTLGRPGASA